MSTHALLTDKITTALDLGTHALDQWQVSDVLADLRAMRETVESATASAVQIARSEGASWAHVGAMLDVSKQAAQQKYGTR